jgi:hypothetical protein
MGASSRLAKPAISTALFARNGFEVSDRSGCSRVMDVATAPLFRRHSLATGRWRLAHVSTHVR